MKKCSKCGQEKPRSEFYASNKAIDGLQNWCKTCQKIACKSQNTIDQVKCDGHLTKVYSNPELAKFTPRQLMQELKARGFTWDYMLEPQKRVMYNKI